MSEQLTNCPICNKKYLRNSLTKHIVQQGQREIYKVYKNNGFCNKKSKGKPHEDFVIKNTYEISKFRIK